MKQLTTFILKSGEVKFYKNYGSAVKFAVNHCEDIAMTNDIDLSLVLEIELM